MNIQFHNGVPLSSCSEDVNGDTVFNTKLGNKTLKNMIDELQSNIDTVRLSSSYNMVENKSKQPREFLFKDYKPILDKVRTGDFSGVQLGDSITLLCKTPLGDTQRVRLIVVHKDPYYDDFSSWYTKNLYNLFYYFFIKNDKTPADAKKEAKEYTHSFENTVGEHHVGVISIFDRLIYDDDDIKSMYPYEHSTMKSNVMKWCYDTIKDAVENRILKREFESFLLDLSNEQYLSVLTQEQVYGRVIKGSPSFDKFQLDYFKNRHLNTLSGGDILLQNNIDSNTYCVATDKFLAPEIIERTSLKHKNIYVIPFFLLN